uniref:Uncharacterized protein n=1 Tax=Strombidinopsis acuminata TaxID=141414 RepID=A0A7S3WTN7_9SPIT
MCAAWDQTPGTPWFSYCPPNADWSDPMYNWCQIPWCYVDESCDSKIATTVFSGSTTAYYSYLTCGNSPDCYSDGPDGSYGNGTTGCPYDPSGEGDNKVSKSSCACKYQGSTLPMSLYSAYPSSDPGKYQNFSGITLYGSSCAAWDQSPNTPWYSSCPSGADWCSHAYNWCQLPWCYVDDACPTKIASSVFQGSSTAFYSYDTCLDTPDCYTKSTRPADYADLPATCPFDSNDNGWATAQTCSAWTATPADASAALGKAAPGAAAAACAAAFVLGA